MKRVSFFSPQEMQAITIREREDIKDLSSNGSRNSRFGRADLP